MSEKLPPLYGKRWAVERIFSRLKEELGIKMIKVREGYGRCISMYLLSLIALLSIALTAIDLGEPQLAANISVFKF